MSKHKFAVIQTGSKQYSVTEGTIIDVEKVDLEAKKTLLIDKVLLFSDGDTLSIGKPYINNVSVKASVLNQIKGDKKIVFKFKNKTGYQKKQGHRQKLTTLKIDSIKLDKKKQKSEA